MSLVCCTDFTTEGWSATLTAAKLAKRLKLTLHLVHPTRRDRGASSSTEQLAQGTWIRSQLRVQATKLSAVVSDVRVHKLDGAPAPSLMKLALRLNASLVIVSAHHQTVRPSGSRLKLAEELAAGLSLPLLIISAYVPSLTAMEDGRPLRVMIAAKDAAQAVPLASAVTRLAPRAGFDATVVHVTPSDGEPQTFGADLDPSWRVHASRARFTQAGADLRAISTLLAPDLIVMGASPAPAKQNVLPALLRTHTSILHVPLKARARIAPDKKLSSVLAATDLSGSGNAAVAVAHRLVRPEGTVHILHVLPVSAGASEPTSRRGEDAARRELRALRYDATSARTRIQIVRSDDLVAAIVDAATALRAEAICLGVGRTTPDGAPSIGSVAGRVLRLAPCQVIFAQPTSSV